MTDETITKTCSKCNEIKPIEEFNKLTKATSGRYPSCKQGSKQYYVNNKDKINVTKAVDNIKNKEKLTKTRADWYLNNKAYRQQADKEYRNNNKDVIAEKNKEWVAENKDLVKTYKRNYYEKNKDLVKQRAIEWKANNKEAVKKSCTKYYKNNTDKCKKACKTYTDKNPHIPRSIKANYRAKKLSATHPDHNKAIELVLFQTAQRVSKCLNIPHHVDHIFPLAKGGIHHHLNLQILPYSINLSKSDSLTWSHPIYKSIKDLPEWLYNLCVSNNIDTAQLI